MYLYVYIYTILYPQYAGSIHSAAPPSRPSNLFGATSARNQAACAGAKQFLSLAEIFGTTWGWYLNPLWPSILCIDILCI